MPRRSQRGQRESEPADAVEVVESGDVAVVVLVGTHDIPGGTSAPNRRRRTDGARRKARGWSVARSKRCPGRGMLCQPRIIRGGCAPTPPSCRPEPARLYLWPNNIASNPVMTNERLLDLNQEIVTGKRGTNPRSEPDGRSAELEPHGRSSRKSARRRMRNVLPQASRPLAIRGFPRHLVSDRLRSEPRVSSAAAGFRILVCGYGGSDAPKLRWSWTTVTTRRSGEDRGTLVRASAAVRRDERVDVWNWLAHRDG